MEFTTDQKKVITIRNHNVLVSAAAGSGKTAVLVERILGLVTDKEHPVDIDRMLVVTFTNAAAAEMRERLQRAILERLEKAPEDIFLQRQSILINHAMITTIDSFCRYILMNHFQEIDLDPGFSIGDPGRMKWMQKNALEKTIEAAYAKKEPDFLNLANAFSVKGRDLQLEEMVNQMYAFVMSQPYPEKWLHQTLSDYECKDYDEFSNSAFFQAMLKEVRLEIKGLLGYYDDMLSLCESGGGPEAYLPVLKKESQLLFEVAEAIDYEGLFQRINAMEFSRLPAAKKDSCDDDVKNQVQALRTTIKDRLKKMQENFFYESGQDLFADMQKAGELLKPLIRLTLSFIEQFAIDKRKENIIDFSDMEHFALQILVDDEKKPTKTALWYQNYFEAVMVDEYQDSNDVQELLLSVVSRERDEIPNRFMVGDMKQSIYRFRMARPEIFMEKYSRYGEKAVSGCARIDLKQNFRSRQTVLSLVNDVFYPLMHQDVGGVEYDEAAALYPGAAYPEDEEKPNAYRAELLLFEQNGENGEKAEMKAAEGEAVMIAQRIKRLMKETRVTDKESGALRPMQYDDIVILTRSIGTLENKLQEVLKREGIPTVVPSKTGYFSAIEIRILLQYLEICVNPYRDIPLAAVLKSPLYGFSDDELAEIALIRSEDEKELSFFEKVKCCDNEKTKAFLDELTRMRMLAKTETVHDFLYTFIRKHRYLDYVSALPAGGSRRETVEMLLTQAKTYEQSRMHGLFGFLQYMKQLEKYEIDYGNGGEDHANAVRIMTIHKSKGLEFPVCFVSGLAKRFNRRDINGSLLLHTDLGIGIEYRNYQEKFRRNTIKQKWIARQQLVDSMGEELRVLYVALTRAKEKCILTGTVSDYEKTLETCIRMVGDVSHKVISDRKLDGQLILECNHYLKLLFYVMALYRDQPEKLFEVTLFHEDDLQLSQARQFLEDRMKKEVFLKTLEAADETKSQKLSQVIHASYPHPELEGLYNKTSVSELKHAALHEDEQTMVVFDTEKKTQIVPEFMKEEVKVLGAARGTAYHRLMELLDFQSFAQCSCEKLNENLINEKKRIIEAKLISERDLSLVDDRKIIAFLCSDLAKKMMAASEKQLLFKEQPFVMEIPAKRVDEKFPDDETMLIQGIIDAFYEEDGKIYLVDYKTDRVEKREELINRYRVQMDYYKEALERITEKKVAGVKIYSFFFSDVLDVE